MRSLKQVFHTLIAGLLLATSAACAQTGPQPAKEVVKRIAGEKMPAVLGAKGYDLTRLFPGGSANPNDGMLVKGSSRYAVLYDGAVFHFASKESSQLFMQNPERYLPGAGGYCLWGLEARASGNKELTGLVPVPGDPAARTYANGRWYLHGSQAAEADFEKNGDAINVRAASAVRYFDSLEKTVMPVASR